MRYGRHAMQIEPIGCRFLIPFQLALNLLILAVPELQMKIVKAGQVIIYVYLILGRNNSPVFFQIYIYLIGFYSDGKSPKRSFIAA